ncbi:putative Small nuclear ribonucleoprotein Sm D2 [Blattamonas nauphoetae]|uniref:Small nuclear ribonucleoprotein Sm D2 n=1 Tax=Blattamonas nauphoetae TaxID=2049346 RepID=A0ABQ9Y6M1_9EUKA|nr:putative Small nuclear ribonucleoprotein Sm D2 [Blattamonas nauphoetae]
MASSLSLKRSTFEDIPAETETKVDDFSKGPFSLLFESVNQHTQILVTCRNNRKILGRLKAFDRHMNLIMESATEFWTENPKKGKGLKKAKAGTQKRLLPKLFVRGDSVILVIRNPHANG